MRATFSVSAKPSIPLKPPRNHGDVWVCFDAHCHWLEVHQLPPYSVELNPTERLWKYQRRTGTHNRYFPRKEELTGALSRVFGEMQSYRELMRSYLQSLPGLL